jgi:hypothetical protein
MQIVGITAMPIESKYFFRGGKFVEYVDPKKFKLTIKEKIGYSSKEEEAELESFVEFYERLILEKPKSQVDKILFDHVFYGQLKHTYVHKISNKSGIKETTFNKNIKKLIEKYNSSAISDDVLRDMSPSGFLLLDRLNISKNNVYFIAGMHRIIEGDSVVKIQILLGKTYFHEGKDGKGKIKYMLAGIDIDFPKGMCLILVHNGNEVPKDDDDMNQVSSPTSFHKYIGQNIIPFLNIFTNIDAEHDREAMFDYCKEMLDKMFAESKVKITEGFEEDVKRFGVKSKRKLKKLGEGKPDDRDITNLVSSIETILLGIYIRSNLKDKDELKKKAQELGLLGYPTKIHYKNSSANKSSTGTSSAQTPIHESETLYSLYTDFGNSNRLEEWSMAWFTNSNPKDKLDVIRTTIHSTQSYFKVVFTATRHLDERIIYHVIRNLNSRRS